MSNVSLIKLETGFGTTLIHPDNICMVTEGVRGSITITLVNGPNVTATISFDEFEQLFHDATAEPEQLG